MICWKIAISACLPVSQDWRQISSHLFARKPAGQRDTYRIHTEFIRSPLSHGPSPLLQSLLSKERHETLKGPELQAGRNQLIQTGMQKRSCVEPRRSNDRKTSEFVDVATGVIGENTPRAQSLLDREEGDEVEFTVGAYIRRAVIETISRTG